MKSLSIQNPILVATLLFLTGVVLSFQLNANYFGISLDEGIYLNGGKRIASGESLYVHIFAFVGPLIYWIQASLHALFGNHLPSLRGSTALSLGAIIASLFFIGKHLAGPTAGLLASLTWLGIWLDLPNRMEVNHRWVSMAFFSMAIASLLSSQVSSRLWNLLAGLFLALAIFTTPSFVLSAIIIGAYLWIGERPRFLVFLLGGLMGCSAILAVLAWQAQLVPFFEGLLWATKNYSQANHFPYAYFGSIVPSRYFLQVYMGAIAIPLSLLALTVFGLWKQDRIVVAPIVYCSALFAATYPKWDAYSLHFVSGPFFVLLFAVLYLLVPNRLRSLTEGLAMVLFAYLTLSAWMLSDRLTLIPTRAGTLMGIEGNVQVMETLEKAIPAKSTLLVYPYLTGLYILLDARLVTHYDFLQPGMMSARDEQIMLEDVSKNPPQFVFWQNFPDEDVVRIWPGSRPGKHRFTLLENWILANYSAGVTVAASNIRGRVWTRNQATR